MPPFYQEYSKVLVSVDCVIFGFSEKNLKLLIQKRPYEPNAGELSLIGGFVKNNENVSDAASRVLTEFTGLQNVYMQQLGVFGDVERDPGERVISVVYYALIDVGEYNEKLSEEHNAQWVSVEDVPKLCFDHNDMVNKARSALKKRINTEPIGFNLLPKYFTLSQLQTLHESILGTTIDKRNFRRSILNRDLVLKTDMIDKKSSRRGAALFEFNLNSSY
jgi:ADP-ribose pyrophosphatase YjhB (NUDIX family)